jgi:hypothetical protein
MAGCDLLWLRLQWLGFDGWLRAANGFGFNGWLRLQWLGFDGCLQAAIMASASMAGCGYNGLASMPGYELQNGFGFNDWL